MEVNCLMGMETDIYIYIGGSAVLKILFLRYLLVLFRYNICKIPLNFLNYQKDRKY
jgi:hypothetical protein